MNSKIFLMSSACFFQEELLSPFSRAMAEEGGEAAWPGAWSRGGRSEEGAPGGGGAGGSGRPGAGGVGMLSAGAGADSGLRQSFLFCSFLFHSRRRRGPSLALISALLGHRLPAAAATRPAPLQRAASLTFCYFLASLLRLPASRLLPPPSPPPPPAGSPPPARRRLRGCPAPPAQGHRRPPPKLRCWALLAPWSRRKGRCGDPGRCGALGHAREPSH